MREQFVTYEIAKQLKDLGFNEKCLAWYAQGNFKFFGVNQYYQTNIERNSIDLVDAPLWQQVIGWLIKEHDLFIDIFKWSVKYYINEELQTPRFLFDIDTYGDYSDDWIYQSVNDDLKYKTYEIAREQAILKAIEIIKNRKIKN